ncbi:MAG: hypothetical protein R2730_05880 [Chitinophagales bacterium]
MYSWLNKKLGSTAAWIITLITYLLLLIGIFYFSGFQIGSFRYMNW